MEHTTRCAVLQMLFHGLVDYNHDRTLSPVCVCVCVCVWGGGGGGGGGSKDTKHLDWRSWGYPKLVLFESL